MSGVLYSAKIASRGQYGGVIYSAELRAPHGPTAGGIVYDVDIALPQEGINVGPHSITVEPLKTHTITVSNVPELAAEPTGWTFTSDQPAASLIADGNTCKIKGPASFDGTSFTVTVTASDGRDASIGVNVLPHTDWVLQGGQWRPMESVQRWAMQTIIPLDHDDPAPYLYIDPTVTTATVEADGTLTLDTTDAGLDFSLDDPNILELTFEQPTV